MSRCAGEQPALRIVEPAGRRYRAPGQHEVDRAERDARIPVYAEGVAAGLDPFTGSPARSTSC